MQKQRITVSVIGGHDVDEVGEKLAYSVGKVIADLGCVLVCGGLDGVMKAASKGAKENGGLTVGLLPGKDKEDANDYIDIALPTTIGYARNAMVASSAHIVVALPGSHGTNSEICYALVYNRPVIDLGGWNMEGMIKVDGVEDAKDKIKELITSINKDL